MKTEKHFVMAFGRMNPPTVGHMKLINKVKSEADKVGTRGVVYTSHSQDPKKNPLTQEQKLKHLSRFSNDVDFRGSSKESPTLLHALSKAYSDGHQHLTLVAGEDRVEEMRNLLNRYNGTEGAHGHFNFKSINVISSGDRDPDSGGTEGASGTKQREAVANDDFDTFRKGVPSHVSDSNAREMFDDVKRGMTVVPKQKKTLKEFLESIYEKRDFDDEYDDTDDDDDYDFDDEDGMEEYGAQFSVQDFINMLKGAAMMKAYSADELEMLGAKKSSDDDEDDECECDDVKTKKSSVFNRAKKVTEACILDNFGSDTLKEMKDNGNFLKCALAAIPVLKEFESSVTLTEGVNDPGIFKAVFLAGGPGSGKSFIVKRTALQAMGLVLINSDVAFENIMRKRGLDFKMPDSEQEQRTLARDAAKATIDKKLQLAIEGRLGLVIDGTGKDFDKIERAKANLVSLGYECGMIFVNTDLETAKKRNAQRERSVKEDLVVKMWKEVQSNLGRFHHEFGNNFYLVDNSEGSNFEPQVNKVFSKLSSWSRTPSTNPLARKWMTQQRSNKKHIKETFLFEKLKRKEKSKGDNSNQRNNYPTTIQAMTSVTSGLAGADGQALGPGGQVFGTNPMLEVVSVREVEKLRSQWDNVDKMDPNSPEWQIVKNYLTRLTSQDLHTIAMAKIKYVSPAAVSMYARRNMRKMGEKIIEANEKENPCWDGYEMIGMKKKKGKKVPNCVKKDGE